jgi:hypothetical protein
LIFKKVKIKATDAYNNNQSANPGTRYIIPALSVNLTGLREEG